MLRSLLGSYFRNRFKNAYSEDSDLLPRSMDSYQANSEGFANIDPKYFNDDLRKAFLEVQQANDDQSKNSALNKYIIELSKETGLIQDHVLKSELLGAKEENKKLRDLHPEWYSAAPIIFQNQSKNDYDPELFDGFEHLFKVPQTLRETYEAIGNAFEDSPSTEQQRFDQAQIFYARSKPKMTPKEFSKESAELRDEIKFLKTKNEQSLDLSEAMSIQVDYQEKSNKLKRLVDGASEETVEAQAELIKLIPDYLRAASSWKPFDISQGIFASLQKWTLGWFESKEEAAGRKQRDELISKIGPDLMEAQKVGAELLLQHIRTDVFVNFDSSARQFDAEIEKLNQAQILLGSYIRFLANAYGLINGKVSEIQAQIKNEIIHAQEQLDQITHYLVSEKEEKMQELRKNARIFADSSEINKFIGELIEKKMLYLQAVMIRTVPESHLDSLANNEVLFHRAVRDVYQEFSHHPNAIGFISQFTHVVEQIAIKRTVIKFQLKEYFLSENFIWKESVYTGYNSDLSQEIESEILIKRKDISDRQNANLLRLQEVEQSIPEMTNQERVDDDIRRALDTQMTQAEWELEKFQEDAEFKKSKENLHEYYRNILQSKLSENSKKIIAIINEKMIHQDSVETLFELLASEPAANVPEISRFLHYSAFVEKAQELKHFKSQLDYLNEIQKIHLDKREKAYRARFIYEQEQNGLDIETNNLRARWLVLQKKSIQFRQTMLGAAKDLNQTEASERKSLASALEGLEEELQNLNLQYRQSLLELQKLANRENKRRYDRVSHFESLPIWNLVKNFVVLDRLDLAEQFREIETTRQLALNGLTSLSETVQGLARTTVSALRNLVTMRPLQLNGLKPTDPLYQVAEYAKKLTSWVNAHPLEAQKFAGNIQHAFDILKNKGFIEAAWNRGSTENIVKDMLLGSRGNIAAAKEIDVMPPEVIAMLYLADWLPESSRMGQALFGETLASKTVFAVGSLFGGPILGAVAALGAGYLQGNAERKIAKAATDHRNAEVTVNALITGVNASGTLQDRVAEAAKYVLIRQSLQAAGNLNVDIQEKGILAGIRRTLQERWAYIREDWKQADLRDRALKIAGIVSMGIVGATIAIGSAFALPFALVGAGAGLVVGGIALSMRQALFPSDQIKEPITRRLEEERIRETDERLKSALDRMQKEIPELEQNFQERGIDLEMVKKEAAQELLKAIQEQKTSKQLEKERVAKLAFQARTSEAGRSLHQNEKYWQEEALKLTKVLEDELRHR
ncbi:MAG: hypothetical protein I8H75_03015 [Myxococcaceae bacterium]|nr:hypothetical protein [Myxococcaceae bacterium]MBH2006300.1 hypothetical protein [Myxococcaceae bacterium]